MVEEKLRRVAALAAVLVGSLGIGADALAAADAHAPPACVAATTVLPDPAQCLRGYGFDSAAGRGDRAEATLAALYKRAGTHMDLSQFTEATQILDCAEAVAGAHPSAAIAQELARRRGVLEFRRECPLQALNWFKRALAEAERSENRVAQGKNWTNIGAALLRLGDVRGALQAQTASLDLLRGVPAEAARPLNNLAEIYRDLGDAAQASRYYRQAHDAHLATGNQVEAAHTLESWGASLLDRGDNRGGEALLLQAREALLKTDNRKYLQRTYAELARAAQARGDLDAAERWARSGLAAVNAGAGEIAPAPLQLQAAQVERLRGRPRAALQRVEAALGTLSAHDGDRPALLAEAAAAHEALGEWPQAMAALRRSEQAARVLREAQYDRETQWLQLRFATAERDRTIAALAAQNRVRSLALWLTVVSALAALLGLTVFFLRRQQRARVAEAARRARLDEEIDYYRRAADELGVDRARLQAALDSREDAVLVLDGAGQVLAANRAASELVQPGAQAPVAGRGFGELLGGDDARRFAQALEHLEESSAPQRLAFSFGGERLNAQLSESGHGEGSIVLGLRRAEHSAAGHSVAEHAVDALPEAGADAAVEFKVEPAGPGDEALRSSFRRALVELMLAVVEAWERSTGQGRLELAEKSRIWRVTVDDGRLRARAMERYLSLSKLPRQPRWRDVLRSGYYVLAECPLEETVRGELQRHVDAVLAYTRRNALV
ncbi:PAS domain-containing protein [Lysobacter enzymogenes]|uniref:TPR repeat-containing protein n=1 Tax=Lysobacter enzymogenes TaxID=69 RepID=A0AAU9ANA5_LYSEN|nr:PAS domain-containing protein [Lysobacter enzymogenes]BAV99197.1 TPR repeat-containing protein [Lysobacter enzymogenes]